MYYYFIIIILFNNKRLRFQRATPPRFTATIILGRFALYLRPSVLNSTSQEPQHSTFLAVQHAYFTAFKKVSTAEKAVERTQTSGLVYRSNYHLLRTVGVF